jgi:hypothetical protein
MPASCSRAWGSIVTNLQHPSRAVVVRFFTTTSCAARRSKLSKKASRRLNASVVSLIPDCDPVQPREPVAAGVVPVRIDTWSLTSLQQRLVKAGVCLVKRALLLAPARGGSSDARPLWGAEADLGSAGPGGPDAKVRKERMPVQSQAARDTSLAKSRRSMRAAPIPALFVRSFVRITATAGDQASSGNGTYCLP